MDSFELPSYGSELEKDIHSGFLMMCLRGGFVSYSAGGRGGQTIAYVNRLPRKLKVGGNYALKASEKFYFYDFFRG